MWFFCLEANTQCWEEGVCFVIAYLRALEMDKFRTQIHLLVSWYPLQLASERKTEEVLKTDSWEQTWEQKVCRQCQPGLTALTWPSWTGALCLSKRCPMPPAQGDYRRLWPECPPGRCSGKTNYLDIPLGNQGLYTCSCPAQTLLLRPRDSLEVWKWRMKVDH